MSTSSSDGPLMVSVSGVRGIVGKTITPEVAVRFAGAVGTWVNNRHKDGASRPSVVLGWDGRKGGDAFYSAAAAGLVASGCDVLPVGIAMTPTIGVAVDDAEAAAGIQITASHNPQMWNGLKVLWRGGAAEKRGELAGQASAPAANIANEIIELFRGGAPAWRTWDGLGAVFDEQLAWAYGDRHPHLVLEQLGDVDAAAAERIAERWPRVVIDCCNASGRLVAPGFLSELGCGVKVLYGEETGLFPHTPEPTLENLTELAAEVKTHRGDVGFAQDPDADRLAIIDENGKYIGEEYTLVLAAMALAEFGVLKKGSKIAVNLSTSRMIEDVAAKYGASVVRTAVGEANVVEAMKKLGPEVCPLGGEGNGGVIWPRVTYVRDSLSGMALVLALMAKTGRTVSQLVASVPSYAIVKRKVDLKDKSEAVRAAEAVKGLFKGARVDTQDGVRMDVDDAAYGKAWLHVRASNTEPIMRLIAEAPTKGQAEKMLDEAAKAIG